MTRTRRAIAALVAAAILSAGLGACSGGDGDVDAGPATTQRRRFPAAVVSTTTPSTTVASGVVAPGATTTTTSRRMGGVTPTTVVSTSTSVVAGRVKPAETPLPTARAGAAAAAWRGIVVVAGGAGAGGNPSVRVDAFDPKAGTWTRGPNLPVPLRDASMAVLGDDLWVVGGFAIESDVLTAQSKTYVFKPDAADWAEGPALKIARGGAAAATVGNFLVVLGGKASDGALLESTESLADKGTAWKSAQSLGQARAFAGALAIDGRIYAAGGAIGTGTSTDAVQSWRAGSPWRTEARLDSARVNLAAAGSCVAGGKNDGGVVANIECYANGFWATVGQMRVPRHSLAAVVLDGYLHLLGGATAGAAVTNTHEVVDLAAR